MKHRQPRAFHWLQPNLMKGLLLHRSMPILFLLSMFAYYILAASLLLKCKYSPDVKDWNTNAKTNSQNSTCLSRRLLKPSHYAWKEPQTIRKRPALHLMGLTTTTYQLASRPRILGVELSYKSFFTDFWERTGKPNERIWSCPIYL